MTEASRAREHVRVAGEKRSWSVHAPLKTRCRNGVLQRTAAAVSWDGITLLSPLPFHHIITLDLDPSNPHLTSTAHVCPEPTETATADLPVPKATAGRNSPISAAPNTQVTALSDFPPPTHQSPSITRASRPQGRCLPLLVSPRSDVSPYPSCPYWFKPQHLTLPSSCVQQQASTYTRKM